MSQQPVADQVDPESSKGRRTGPSLAVVLGGVLVFALICGGVIAVVVTFAYGKVNRIVRSSYHMQALTKAIINYSVNNKGYLPPIATWDTALAADYGDAAMLGELLDSPRIEGTSNEMIYTPPRSTRANGFASIEDVAMPGTWIVIREDENRLGPRDPILVGYLDGEVRIISRDDLTAQLAQQAAADVGPK